MNSWKPDRLLGGGGGVVVLLGLLGMLKGLMGCWVECFYL